MDLTLYQQEMLDGRFGKGKAMAMRIQVAIGDGFRAQRMVPITRAHVALSAQEADTWFARKLRDAGAVCAIPPTVNPGYCLKLFEQLGYINAKSSALMRETHEVYRDSATFPGTAKRLRFLKQVSRFMQTLYSAQKQIAKALPALCALPSPAMYRNTACCWMKTAWELSSFR